MLGDQFLKSQIIALSSPCNAWPWKWRHYNLSKHQELLTHWHIIISHYIWIFNGIAVIAFNLTIQLAKTSSTAKCMWPWVTYMVGLWILFRRDLEGSSSCQLEGTIPICWERPGKNTGQLPSSQNSNQIPPLCEPNMLLLTRMLIHSVISHPLINNFFQGFMNNSQYRNKMIYLNKL